MEEETATKEYLFILRNAACWCYGFNAVSMTIEEADRQNKMLSSNDCYCWEPADHEAWNAWCDWLRKNTGV